MIIIINMTQDLVSDIVRGLGHVPHRVTKIILVVLMGHTAPPVVAAMDRMDPMAVGPAAVVPPQDIPDPAVLVRTFTRSHSIVAVERAARLRHLLHTAVLIPCQVRQPVRHLAGIRSMAGPHHPAVPVRHPA